MSTLWNVIFLGNPGVALDPTEGNETAENAAAILVNNFGSFGSAANPLNRQVYEAQSFVQPNGSLFGNQPIMDSNNNFRNDGYDIDLNRDGTSERYIHDTAIYYNATITFVDGRVVQGFEARIFQTTTGELFLAPSLVARDITILESGAIQSIALNSVALNGPRVRFNQDRTVNNLVACFCAGTLIATPQGPRKVETLRCGDLVETLDNGAKPLVWTGQVSVDLTQDEKLRPIRISKGALGDNQPEQDLLVSPQHRVFVRSKIAERMFNTSEVLIAAKHLLTVDGIDIATDIDLVTYVHFLFDRHEIVTANGALTESMYTGAEALKAVSKAARDEIMTLFPALANSASVVARSRYFVAGREGRVMTNRHIKNGQNLVQGANSMMAVLPRHAVVKRAG